MSNTFTLLLPVGAENLRTEIMTELSSHANVQEAPAVFGFNEIKLVIEIVSDSIGIAGNAAALVTFFLLLKERRKQNQEPVRIQLARLGEPALPLEEADEAALRRIVGLDEIKSHQK